MLIPKKVWNVLNQKKYFDYMFLEMLRNHKPEVAYDKAIEEIRQYAPKFNHYKDYESYRARLHYNQDKKIEVPDNIINAVTDDIDELFQEFYKKVQQRKLAYELTLFEINKHFPLFKPYANYQAYKSLQSINHKKKMIKVKNITPRK